MSSAKWRPFCLGLNVSKGFDFLIVLYGQGPGWQHYTFVRLTHKQLETHWYILSAVATDALVLKHQAISIQSVTKYSEFRLEGVFEF